MGFTTDNIRNVAIVGHGDTGKTTLVEQMLFYAGVINKFEPVESGKTVSDFTDEEIAQQISIHASLTHCEWKDKLLNIIDTPGAPDFIGEVVASFRSTESAVMVVGGRSGVQIETIKLWRRLDKRNMPRILFINKMNKERANFNEVMDGLREKFEDTTFIPITIPIGQGSDFKGLVNLLDMKAHYFCETEKKENLGDIPDDIKALAEKYHQQLIEAAAEGDDELLDKYFEEGELSIDEARHGLREGLIQNKFVPVICGAAELNSGIETLLNFITFESPCPTRLEEPCVSGEKARMISPEGEASAYVFKTSIDQFSGKLSYVKIITGTLKSDSEIYNSREGKKEKISKVYKAVGKKLTEVKELIAGDIGVLAKLDSVKTNDTLCSTDDIIHYKALALPHPVHSVAISVGSTKEEDKLSQMLHKVLEEDLTFKVDFNAETKETVVSGMGEMHINMILDKIRTNQKINIDTKVPKVAYRETISKPANAEYTHKKQTGGHGQFARVVLEIAPLPRGDEFEFVNAISGGAISKGYIPGVEKGVKEGMLTGVLAGFPVVDVKTRVVDGKEHSVDSSEMAFKMAAKGAFKDAMEKASPVLLEPVAELHIFVNDEYLGDVLSDLSSKRGRVLGQESIGSGIQEIQANVPMSELLRYSIDLRSITSGTASFEMKFSHYSPLTGRNADEVIKAHKSE